MKKLSTEAIESGFAILKASIEMGGSLSDTTWDYLKAHSEPYFYPKKTTIIKEGERPTITGFLLQGAAKAYYISPKDGRKVVTKLYVPNEICGPDNFHLGEPSGETIEFVSDSWLLSSSYKDIMFMHDNFPDYYRIYTRLLEYHNREQKSKVRDLQILTASQRLENLIATTPHYFNYFSVVEIASYLGTERETLTRLRSKLYK